MEKIKVYVGSVVAGHSGQVNDGRRPVEFVGEELARSTTYGFGRGGGLTDSRGVTETLYKTEDGRYIVHVKDWSHWAGEPDVYELHEVTDDDLQPGGEFEDIAREAGLGRSLTLDEALS